MEARRRGTTCLEPSSQRQARGAEQPRTQRAGRCLGDSRELSSRALCSQEEPPHPGRCSRHLGGAGDWGPGLLHPPLCSEAPAPLRTNTTVTLVPLPRGTQSPSACRKGPTEQAAGEERPGQYALPGESSPLASRLVGRMHECGGRTRAPGRGRSFQKPGELGSL